MSEACNDDDDRSASEDEVVTAEIYRLWAANPDVRIHIFGGGTVQDLDLGSKRLFLSNLRDLLSRKATTPAGDPS